MSSCVKLQETRNWTLFVTAFQSNNWSRNKWRSARQAVLESDQRVQLPGLVNEKRSNACFLFNPYVPYENDLKVCVLFMLISRILSWWNSVDSFFFNQPCEEANESSASTLVGGTLDWHSSSQDYQKRLCTLGLLGGFVGLLTTCEIHNSDISATRYSARESFRIEITHNTLFRFTSICDITLPVVGRANSGATSVLVARVLWKSVWTNCSRIKIVTLT